MDTTGAVGRRTESATGSSELMAAFNSHPHPLYLHCLKSLLILHALSSTRIEMFYQHL